MNHKRFLADFEVESHACLDDEHNLIQSIVPSKDIEIHVSNHNVTPGIDRPLLSVQLIYSATDLKDAAAKARPLLSEYLTYLCFASNMPIWMHKLIRVIDWTAAGLKSPRW